MTRTSHVDIAAYALGVLDEQDNQAFEEHLVECSRCQFELIELQDVADALEEIRHPDGPARQEPGRAAQEDGSLESLLNRAKVVRRRTRRNVWLAAAAAITLIVAGPVVTLAVVDSSVDSVAAPGPGQVGADAPRESTQGIGPMAAVQPGGPVHAKVSLRGKEWGTTADLELGGVVGPLRCQLVAVSRYGEELPVTSWSVPQKGYGVPGSPEPLRISGGVGLTPDEIERFEVRTDDGEILVSVDI